MKFNYDTEILTHWIVITAHYWGKGESRDEAMKNCMKVKGSRARLKEYNVLRVGDEARVDGMGGVEFDPRKGYAQVEVVRDGKPTPENEYMRLPNEGFNEDNHPCEPAQAEGEHEERDERPSADSEGLQE